LIDCPGVVPTSAHDTNTDTVLKGVVRVEALPVPSDHISTLLERVKPIYLARTYGLEVPDSGFFDADTILDTLARKKGRLLKGGEPDREGVAKILLSDWVRGRIPFFVPPPERPEGLTSEESKVGSGETLGVKQKLGGLIQRNKFDNEDRVPEGGSEDTQEEVVESQPSEEEATDGNESDEDEELQWEDVYPDDKKSSDENEKTQVGEEDVQSSKEPRMTTSKRKATNFYSHNNVKNRNRNKKARVGQSNGENKRRR